MAGTVALIVAAGRGVRAGGEIPKQYREIGGVPVLRRTIAAFLSHPAVDRVLVAIAPGDSRYADVAPQNEPSVLPPVIGGETRQESVRMGLESLAGLAPDRVLIHDGARPFVSAAVISRVIAALDAADAVIPALPVPATLKAVNEGGIITGTVPRAGLQAAETPQGFRFDAILAAHRRAADAAPDCTDDAAVAEWAGMAVTVVPGEAANIKLTSSEDIAMADHRELAEAALALGDIRVGTGYDVHAFGPGNEVMLGGVAIPHNRGVIGHSDADVVLHALTDAVLGAIAEGDIGVHFPPSDPRWKDASSDRFLAFAVERVHARGGRIGNVDVAVVTEGPRIAEHRDAIRTRIAGICRITPDRVGVKATTNENLGFIGRGEGLAAYAVATVRLPFGPDAS
ncbi:MAG: bifunctional 2-C-methyl-D-erythritol 4-phosphate cytidylyltransferase/2-C-methyl-D-erythritol 2,4-cyclodiphosphate synthase [Rhizobiales bacterium]|nr:bifunctional 2-C-methyl-D-erythritol 4-phosphate cytidylyltransferase/2-C-methyl-D-erythritol 2,4-cyclodiphosphate synthase [Hyphomicrobiales bacterium]